MKRTLLLVLLLSCPAFTQMSEAPLVTIMTQEDDADERLSSALKSLDCPYRIYFGIYDFSKRDADHIATVRRSKNGHFDYTIAGHGISPRTHHPRTVDEVLLLVKTHNSVFNMTEAIHMQKLEN